MNVTVFAAIGIVSFLAAVIIAVVAGWQTRGQR